jgi:hypothetical protein
VALAGIATVCALSSACSPPRGDDWTALAPPSTQVGAVLTLTTVGDVLVAGTTTGSGEPGLQVFAAGTWTSRPVRPTTPYGRVAQWLSIVDSSDGGLVAIGGARGGAHSNVRWSVWRGSLADGLTEQEQVFSTFGGWGAGEQIGPVATGAGPLLIGSWESAKAGLDLAVWLPQGQAWVRQSSAGTALESTPTLMTGGRSVAAWGGGALVLGSALSLGDGSVRKLAALWHSTSGNTGWTRIELPESGSAGEAVSAGCTPTQCTIVGWVDGWLAVWRLGTDGSARRVAGIPPVAVRDSDVVPPPAFLDGRAVLLVGDEGARGTTALVSEGPSGWSRDLGPRGSVIAFTALGATLYAVCRDGDTPQQVWARPS